MDVKPGDRIRLIEMPKDPDPIAPGTEGVVGHVEEVGGSHQIIVNWDIDRSLSLIVPPDRFEVISHEEVPEPWASIYKEEK